LDVLPPPRIDFSHGKPHGWGVKAVGVPPEVAVDETKTESDGDELYVRTAVDCDTLEALSVDVFAEAVGFGNVLLKKRTASLFIFI